MDGDATLALTAWIERQERRLARGLSVEPPLESSGLAAAMRKLELAEASGKPDLIFIARGDVQRLGGRRG